MSNEGRINDIDTQFSKLMEAKSNGFKDGIKDLGVTAEKLFVELQE